MSARWEGHNLVLSSGRVLEPNCGIVGITADFEADDFAVYGGFDQAITPAPGWEALDGPPWTLEERREVAEAMIAIWKRFGGIA